MKNLVQDNFQLFSFFEVTPDLVCIAGKDGFFKRINPAVIHKLEYSAEELYASPIDSFMHHEDKDHTLERRKALFEGEVMLNFVNRYFTKSGKIVWLEWTSIYFADREVIFGIAKDVTERKQMEIEVEKKYKKFKSLATHFKSSIEQDRKFLAYELHEELAQLVAAVKMDIDWIAHHTPELTDLSKSRVEHALAISGLLIKSIQRLSFSISPRMLDDFGLNATMEWLCKEFFILNEIPYDFKAAYDEKDLTHEMQIDFFRICQEALANVIDHASAGKVSIRIEESGNQIKLTITDDGNGFDVLRQKQAHGLTSMRERAASINGHLLLESKIGEGTRIVVTVQKELEI